MRLEQLLEDASLLTAPTLQAATRYRQGIPTLVAWMDRHLGSHPDLLHFIGPNPVEVMFTNHRHHAALMATVFELGDFRLLARTVPWVYRAYGAHGFSLDYFEVALAGWREAMKQILQEPDGTPMHAAYLWMESHHEDFIRIAASEEPLELPASPQWQPTRQALLDALLQGSLAQASEVVNGHLQAGHRLEDLYQYVIQPTLYEIGRLWEQARISVAREHVASAIMTRIMATLNAASSRNGRRVGSALVSASSNEFHELGAWMVADLLEQDGWEVHYLGANTPATDLLTMARELLPDIIAVSVTMPFNVTAARHLISAVRHDKALDGCKVLVGGRAFIEHGELWKSTGADGFAATAVDAKSLARTWVPSYIHG